MFVYLNIAASILLLSVELSNKDSDIVLVLQLFLLSIHIATQCKKSHKFSNVLLKATCIYLMKLGNYQEVLKFFTHVLMY